MNSVKPKRGSSGGNILKERSGGVKILRYLYIITFLIPILRSLQKGHTMPSLILDSFSLIVLIILLKELA